MNDFGQAHEGGSMPVGPENATTAGDRETAPTAVARLEALIRVSEALRAYRDRDTLFHGLARELRSVVPFSFLGLALYDEQTNAVQRYVLQTTGEPVAAPQQLQVKDSLAHWILQHQKPLVIPDVENETRPGNVRELRNALERAAILCEGALITAEHLSLNLERPVPPPEKGPGSRGRHPDQHDKPTTDLNVLERGLIAQALADSAGNKSRAAGRLGISRKQLYVRLRKYQLS
jgi:transcriptional regulator with GAF, ATPase, and Fis domain